MMRCHHFEALESRTLFAVLADASTAIPGVRGDLTQYADFNDDGILDAIGRTSKGWTVDFGRADGTFERGSTSPVIGVPQLLYNEAVVLGRWTPGDDSIDIVLIRRIDREWTVRLFSNNGHGVFARHAPQVLTGANLRVYPPHTGEARRGPDEASEVLWSYSNKLRALRFDASGAIVSDSIISTKVKYWYHADFDLDGDDELLISRALGPLSGPATVQVAERGDDDAWSFTTLIEGTDAQRELYAGDLDGDDRPDIGWARGRNITILRNTTDPGDAEISFAPPAAFITVEPETPTGGAFTDADRSLIVDTGQFDDGQPPAVIVQTYTYTFSGRDPHEILTNFLLRPQGDDDDRTWSIATLGTASGYIGSVDRYGIERLIDIGDDNRADVVGARSARRNIADADIHRPVIGQLVVAPLDPATGTRTLIASNLSDSDGAVLWINFYHDTDGNDQWSESDLRIRGVITRSANGSARQIVLGVDHVYGSPGTQRFFARAWDDKGLVSETVSADLVISGATPPEPAAPSVVPELTPPPAQAISTTGSVLPIATADFTGDGRPDILRYQRNAGARTQQLYLLVGLPPRPAHPDELRFAAPRLIAADDVVHGVTPDRVLVGRFTSGDDLDIVFTRQLRDKSYELVVLINNGDGRFTVAADKARDRYRAVSTPFSADGASGRQSFIAHVRTGGFAAIRLNDDGSVARQRPLANGLLSGSLFASGGTPAIQAADFNGDGRDELVVARNLSYPSGTATFQLLTPLARGGFTISSLTSFGIHTPWIRSFRLGDVDGDGTPDLVVAGSRYINNMGIGAEAWLQVHRVANVGGQVQVVEAREVFRDQYNVPDVLDEEINILGIGDATGDGAIDISIELLNGGFDDVSLRAIVIETPWSTQSQSPQPHTILHAGNPAGADVEIGVVFRMGDADGDGVLDLFRRDQVLELYRGL